MGPPFRLLLLHKNNRGQLFHRIGATQILRVLTKSWSRILFGSAHHKLLLVLTKLSIHNCFWSIGPPQGVARTHKNHASDTGGGWARLELLLLHTIIETTFHRIRATQESVLTKIMEPNFIRIGPPLQVVMYSKVINTTVFGVSASKVLLVLTKSCIRHRRRMGLSDCCSYTQE
jgi:hypothetical protein